MYLFAVHGGNDPPGSQEGTWKEVPTNHKIRLLKTTNFLLDSERKGQWGRREVAPRKEGTCTCKGPGAGTRRNSFFNHAGASAQQISSP